MTGAINITASGGTGVYTYDWDDIPGTNNSEDRTGLAEGTYSVIVRDANGCSTASLSVIITEPTTAVTVVKTSQTDVSCFEAQLEQSISLPLAELEYILTIGMIFQELTTAKTDQDLPKELIL